MQPPLHQLHVKTTNGKRCHVEAEAQDNTFQSSGMRKSSAVQLNMTVAFEHAYAAIDTDINTALRRPQSDDMSSCLHMKHCCCCWAHHNVLLGLQEWGQSDKAEQTSRQCTVRLR